MPGKLIVAGALGLVGRAVLEHFESLEGWEIVALSRRPPDFPTKARFVAVDLNDAADARVKLAGVRGATHAVYAALFEKPDLGRGWLERDQIATNRAMLLNFLDAVEPGNPGLSHLALLQGTKAYGIHLGPMNVPAKESAPRHPHPNFYWAQEDLVRARRPGASWRWTIFRPQVVIGFAVGSAMNMLAAVGVYAAISRELGLPLVFPGVGRTVLEATDARLLARAIAWAGAAPAAVDETFNVTNGDVFTWRNVWPAIARHFGMEVGLDQRMPLGVVMADKGEVWARLVERHRLLPYSLETLIGSSWQFADFSLGDRQGAAASLMSTIKLRRAGFADCIDTEEMFGWWLGELQRRRVLPP
jgi:nucleoside-diphosphate-sugar epimerase